MPYTEGWRTFWITVDYFFAWQIAASGACAVEPLEGSQAGTPQHSGRDTRRMSSST